MEAVLQTEALDYSDVPDLVSETIIRSIKTRILDVPTIRHHKLSNTSVAHQSYVHVDVHLVNGFIGHGEASTLGGPRWSEESVEAIKANIDNYLAPALIGQPVCHVEACNVLMSKAARRNFAAKSAINAAIMDALGRTLNVSVATLLGGAVRSAFPVIWALASGDAIQEVEEARAKIAAGQFNRFKIKLGFVDPATDIARLEHLRSELPTGTELIADVNQAWSEAQCCQWLPALAGLDIALIEQPVDAELMETMSRISAGSDIPVMLDEAVFTPAEALRATSQAAGSVLSLKLCKHGSVQATQRVAGIAAAGGIELYGGCLLESSLGAAAHLAVFATLPDLHWGCEHFGPQILVDDTTEDSLVYKDFRVHLPSGPGLGVQPNPEKVEKYLRRN